MSDEVTELKKVLSENFASDASFSPLVVPTTPITRTELKDQTGEDIPAEHYGPGLDFANWLVNRRRLRRFERTKNDLPRIVAQGDSWFLHPLVPDIVDHLSDYAAIRSLAAAGAEIGNYDTEQIVQAIRRTDAKMFIMSGGGNDLLGVRFGDWLFDYEPPQHLLNEAYNAQMDFVLGRYREIIQRLLKEFPSLRVVIHGYDFVVPAYGSAGKWLGRPLEARGYGRDKDHVRRKIVDKIVNDFYGRLGALCRELNSSATNEKVALVDARNQVNGWYDEIHPNGDNARKVAELFASKLKLLPGS